MVVETHDRTYPLHDIYRDDEISWYNYSGLDLQSIGRSSSYPIGQHLLMAVRMLFSERTGFGIGHFDPFVVHTMDAVDDFNDFENFPPQSSKSVVLRINDVTQGAFRPSDED